MKLTTSATLASGKTGIKLDLNGKTINMNSYSIINNGTLDIYTSQDGAIIESSATNVLDNNGTLTLNGTSSTKTMSINGTSSNYDQTVFANRGNGTVNAKTTITYTEDPGNPRYLMYNEGTLNINGATLINRKET